MLHNIGLLFQRPKKACQFTAIALAYVRITQHKWVTPQFMKRDLLVGEQLVPRWHCDHQRVMPHGFGNNALTDIRRMREPNREVARPQATQIIGQRP